MRSQAAAGQNAGGQAMYLPHVYKSWSSACAVPDLRRMCSMKTAQAELHDLYTYIHVSQSSDREPRLLFGNSD